MAKAVPLIKSRASVSKIKPWALPETGYVRERELLAHVLPVASSTLARMVKRGKFPAGVKLSARVTGYRVDDVRKWLASPAEYRASTAGGAE